MPQPWLAVMTSNAPESAMTCPFNSVAYLSGLSNIGTPESDEHGQLSVLKRRIPGSELYDGIGPWPYLWVESQQVIRALQEAFQDLVTLTVVTQPGYVPRGPWSGSTFLKNHFVYDPVLPEPPMSKRTRIRLSKCEARASFSLITGHERRMACIALYRRLMQRRGLVGCFVDFPDGHFNSISLLENSVFFEVADSEGTGAFSCGVVFNGILQVLHMASSDEGLRWNASYLLMKGMQDYARSNRVRLMTGGMPDAGSPGLQKFKRRWSNAFEPVHIMKIINNAALYDKLCEESGRTLRFFPGYRAPSPVETMICSGT